jgi:pyrroline-5-carboxylate reductase
MGRSIAAGMVAAGVTTANRLMISDHATDRAQTLARELGASAAADNTVACRDADVILLCVKPKEIVPVLQELVATGALVHRPLVISIAAGVCIDAIEAAIGDAVPVVRAMPNTASVIGRGMTAICRGTHATDDALAIAHIIFGTLGRSVTLEERHFDAVTAVSASGPAFIYVILEALADGGVQCGLPRGVATELAAQMALGAASMVLTTGRHPAALKDDVTTPGGCTIAGLLALEDGRIRSVLARTVEITAGVAAGLARR